MLGLDMPDPKAIEILRLIKTKTAGAILAQVKPERAAKLTEQLLAQAERERDETRAEMERIHRAVLDVLDEAPTVSADVLALCRWMADYYVSPVGLVLRAALPASMGRARRADPAVRTLLFTQLAYFFGRFPDKAAVLAAVGSLGGKVRRALGDTATEAALQAGAVDGGGQVADAHQR